VDLESRRSPRIGRFMTTPRKLLLLLAILLVAASVIFVQSFNTLAGKNRDQVRQELQKFLGRDATFDHLEASVWDGLGFSAKEFRIADNPRFAATPLVRARELKLGVSWIQLLFGRIVVDSLAFHDPEFQIITDEQGVLNLSALTSGKKDPSAFPRPRMNSLERKLPSVSFLVTNFTVENGRVDFIDRSVREPAEMRVKNVEMEIKGIDPTGKSRIKFAAALTEGLGHDVRIEGLLGPLRPDRDWSQQALNLSMEFDSLSVPLLARALPLLRNRIPRELDVTGPMSLQANLEGTLDRPRITDVALKVPLFGSSNYNALLEGELEIPEPRSWAKAQLKGTLKLDSINLAQFRNLPFLKQSLPDALVTKGLASLYSRFEGTWENLRMGALIRAEKSELRYGDWLRKSAGSSAQLAAQISRKKNRLILHPSVLTLDKAKVMISGVAEEAPEPRLLLRVHNDSSPLAAWGQLAAPLSFYATNGTIDCDLIFAKSLAFADPWNIRGNLRLLKAEFRHKESGKKIDQLNADVFFLGRAALLKDLSFRLGSSQIAIAARVNDLSQPSASYTLRSRELNLLDMPAFPSNKPHWIKNVTAKGDIQSRDGVPLLRATVSSSEGSLGDIVYRELSGEITWSQAGVAFNNLSLRTFDGKLRADGVWSFAAEKPQRFAVSSQLEAVAVGSLLAQRFPQLKDRVEGKLDFRGQIHATTQNGKVAKETLQGSGETLIRDGTIHDFNLIAMLVLGDGATANVSASPRLPSSLAALFNREDTHFDTLKANLIVDQQRIRTDDLLLATPEYTVTAAGWIAFDQSTRWNGVLVLSPRLSQELQREYKMLRYLLDRRGRLSVSFRGEGKYPNIKLTPENRALAQALRQGFSPGEPVGGEKSPEKGERKQWLPDPLERLLRQ
jgi:AsmA-like C-terminal region/AsmA family